MSTGSQKPKKAGRILGLFKRKDTSTVLDQSETANQPQTAARFGDNERTRDRYLKAVCLLEDALKGRNEKWGDFEIPKLEGELEKVNPEEFRGKLEALSESFGTIHDRTWVGKCAYVLQCCFTAFAPFAKNFLAIAKEGSQVLLLTIVLSER